MATRGNGDPPHRHGSSNGHANGSGQLNSCEQRQRLQNSTVRTLVRRIGKSRAAEGTVSMLERLLPARRDSLHVLMYHRVADPRERPDLHPSLLSATPDGFAQQAAFLASSGRVVSSDTVLAAFRGEATMPAGAILITFDDAYSDFAEHAWPSLNRRGLPATLFVPTAYPDDPDRHFWWDRLHVAMMRSEGRDELITPAGQFRLHSAKERVAARNAIAERLRSLEHRDALAELDALCASLEASPPGPAVLSWSELATLQREGVALAAHTRTHPLLSRIAHEDALEEIVGSRDDLVAHIGHAPPLTAYPGGSFTDKLAGVLPEHGIELAFTTRRSGVRVGKSDPLRLGRINIGVTSALPLVRAQLLLMGR